MVKEFKVSQLKPCGHQKKVEDHRMWYSMCTLHIIRMHLKCVFSEDILYLCLPLGSGLNDGQWHAIRLVAKENFAMLTIDGEEASAVHSTSPLTINTGGTYHLGGKGQPSTITTDLIKKQHSPHSHLHSSGSSHCTPVQLSMMQTQIKRGTVSEKLSSSHWWKLCFSWSGLLVRWSVFGDQCSMFGCCFFTSNIMFCA